MQPTGPRFYLSTILYLSNFDHSVRNSVTGGASIFMQIFYIGGGIVKEKVSLPSISFLQEFPQKFPLVFPQ